MTDPAWALQKGILARLAANSALVALLPYGAASIFDDVPEDEKFPYVTIGDIQTNEWDTSSELGAEHVETINVWTSRGDRANGTAGYEGRKSARDILAQIYQSLHQAAFNLDGNRLVNLRFQFSAVLREDAEAYHGVIRFRAVTEPSS